MNHEPTPAKVRLTEGLGPLPEADGTAEANKERHPEGGYTFDEIPAWSERLVRAYAAEQVTAERERWAHVFDGMKVFQSLTPEQIKRTDYALVSDVLDVVARLSRA
jgi:hypothetical protein